jgi:predicted Zn finger-like uncharacterized protein
MPIGIKCEKCGQGYRVKDELIGKRVKCKQCGHTFVVPDPADPQTPEVSESGAPILRHQPRERSFEPPVIRSESAEQLEDHIRKYVGKVESVFHELVSDIVHIDVHWVPPTPERDFHTLVTTGMSDRPMTAPAGAEDYRYGELLISLPREWPLWEEAFEDERNYWPVRWLKQLARFPHEYETWLAPGHTIPNGDPPEPFAPDTKLCCWLLWAPALVAEEFVELTIDDQKTVHFMALIPLYEEEMQLKLVEGVDPLIDRLADAGVTELLDLDRTNTCKRGLWPP